MEREIVDIMLYLLMDMISFVSITRSPTTLKGSYSYIYTHMEREKERIKDSVVPTDDFFCFYYSLSDNTGGKMKNDIIRDCSHINT